MAKIHGLSKEFWYNSYRSMMDRCYREKAANYCRYGGRGIKVCKEWHDIFEFKKWAITSGYFEGSTIDRIDYDKDYCPENCRWATKKEQAINRQTTRYITHNGETHNVTEWAEIIGIDKGILLNRLWRGWNEHDIFDLNKYVNQYERRNINGIY